MDYKQQLSLYLAQVTDLPANEAADLLETPPDPSMGDFAFPCFKLARTWRKAPPVIAAEIKEKLTLPDFVSRAEVAGPYLNFFLDQAGFAKSTLGAIAEAGEKYGSSTMGEGKKVVIDYSSINIAKPFHIGHLSTTAIGNALYRIYGFLGYTPVGVNHLGDWGTQFGKLIYAYKTWGSKEDVEKRSIHALLELYVRFHDEAEKNPALNDEGRAWFKKIEDGDEEALALWNWFKEVTLKEVGKIYDLLGVKFDSYAGEAFYNDKMQPVIDELREKNMLELSEGAYVVRLDEYDLAPCIILKSDGTTLYATRDLAAAFYRKENYDFHKCLYVVAYQQNLHFKQLFKVIELMGYDWAKDMVHVNFGMVSLPDGTLSTRKGHVVFLEDVLKQAIAKTRAVMEEKNPDLENKDQVAQDIGVGAVVFSALSGSRIKDIVFDLDRVLNFDGETGPYVQYTHARALSVIRKAGNVDAAPDYSALVGPQALSVLKLLEAFPEVIKKACDKNEPSFITRHVVDLAQAFNKFYYDVRIIDEDAAVTAARLELARATAQVLKTGLHLIGVNAPDRM
ncbi:MAG: arginine--tRNA ligase [Christensenellaceae bacterium]|nr:arginine--tRNA ligase [Christensenellaceae bacterium]